MAGLFRPEPQESIMTIPTIDPLTAAIGAPIPHGEASRLVDVAIAAAASHGFAMSVAIVDMGGVPVALKRMDGAFPASAEMAFAKARAAAAYKRPSKALQDAATSGFTPILSLVGGMPLEGGIPILANGVLVGAIGVSGGDPDQDGAIATTALAS
jgi:glc operon protein GlcG